MSDWSRSEILHFLECYQQEPCIWNPKHKDHKNKNKVAHAWHRLSEIIKKPVAEIKNKKAVVMVTFRKHLKKKQGSIRSGSGAGDIYEPTWFAYPLMESFLLPVYTSKTSVDSETQSRTPKPEVDEIENETEERENYIDLEDSSTSATAGASIQSAKKSTEKSRRYPAPRDIAEQQIAMALSQLTNALSHRYPPSCEGKEDDECDLYAKLLAEKIRELPTDERKIVMYEIDGLFIKRINRRSFSRETPSPQYFDPYSRPLSAAQNFSYVPVTANLVSNLKETSTPLPPSAQNMRESVIIHSTQPNSSNLSSKINILSEEIIVPPKKSIIDEAFSNAYDNFEGHNIE